LNSTDFEYLAKSDDNEVWSCLKCNSEILPFCSEPYTTNPDTSLNSISTEFKTFFSNMNSLSPSDVDDDDSDELPGEMSIDCKYYDCNEFFIKP